MHTDKLTVNAREYWLSSGQDLPGLKNAVVEAARAGGDLVGFDVVGDTATLVLVTAHSAVTFQTYECDPTIDGATDDTALAKQWLDVEDLVA